MKFPSRLKPWLWVELYGKCGERREILICFFRPYVNHVKERLVISIKWG